MKGIDQYIRAIRDFPKPGIVFRDITPLLANPRAMRIAVNRLLDPYLESDVDVVAGMEARGFIFGSLVALELGVGFVPLRKPGKLPHITRQVSYELEYGNAILEAHVDAVTRGQRVLLVDDLLATGGTAAASAKLIQHLGGALAGFAFVIELDELNGRERLAPAQVHSVLHY